MQPQTELQIIQEIARLRLAARRLVASQRAKIELVAAALMQQGALTSDELTELFAGAPEPVGWLR